MPQGMNYTSAGKGLPQRLESTAPANPLQGAGAATRGAQTATAQSANRQGYQTAGTNQMLFTDRGGVYKRNVESQGGMPSAKENPVGFNTNPVGEGKVSRPMKD
jgi:hypothetical protein